MKPLSPVLAFRNVLSLEYLFEYWRAKRNDPNPVMAGLSRTITKIAEEHPELAGTISDMSLMETNQAVLAPLWSTIIPATAVETEMIAVTLPFEMTPVYATTPFLAMMDVKKSQQHDVKTSHQILLSTWRFVLSQLYGLNEGMPPAAVIDWEDSDGLHRFSRVDINHAFCRVVATGSLPELTLGFRRELLDASNDPGRLAALLPTDRFEFRGFVVLRAIDITGIEIVSRLKYLLIGDQALTDPVNYRAILNLVRAALHKPTMELYLVAYRGDQVIMLQQALRERSDCILTAQSLGSQKSFEGTLYGRTHHENRPFALSDLKESQSDPKLKMLYEEGIRSVLTVPLSNGTVQVGIAVLCSPDPTGVSAGDLDVLSEILPLLALGVRRSVENLDRQVQQIIQRNWTSIHPAVAWKFEKEAAQSLIGGIDSMKPIIFENVSPLYAVSDIRNSSVHRSQAILADLNRQLELGLNVIQAARQDRALPLLEELEYRMELQKNLLSDGMNTGDEISVMNFLKRELEPLFDDLAKGGAETRRRVEVYRKTLHHEAHSLYERRKDFDESVQKLNRTIGDYLDQAQSEAQSVFPHYFDKTTTDGVDHTIYVGASLVPNGEFDSLYLQNLKLWQLITLCRVARLTADLGPQLPVPLEMTHLIMVQDLPITIRFNNDEKRFVVDGAYNIRYEIMKKRIDKAVVKGSGQRLTQPGQIAIVYSQEEEARDYRRFISFLTAKKWLESGVEELELDDLQGIHGLRSLRVKVSAREAEMPSPKEISELNHQRRRRIVSPIKG